MQVAIEKFLSWFVSDGPATSTPHFRWERPYVHWLGLAGVEGPWRTVNAEPGKKSIGGLPRARSIIIVHQSAQVNWDSL